MRFLFVSGELIGSALCHRLLREGHDVKLYVENVDCKNQLDNIVPKVENWLDELNWVGQDGIIVFDDVGYGETQDRLRKQGYKVVGGSAEGDRYEKEREYFQKILAELGLPVLPSIDFKTGEEAIAFVKKNRGPWVVKQNTHNGVLTHVGESSDDSDVINLLNNYKILGMSAHLQKKVQGIEVAVGRYFDGNNWIGPICTNHEHKRLCNDDIGPLTPEMGTVVKYSWTTNILYERTLAKLKPLLKESNYRGYFDINCIVDEENIWPLEATARFGTPITELQVEMLETSLADFLNAIATGNRQEPTMSSGYGVTVCIAVPPFPFLKKNATKQVNILPEKARIMFNKNTSQEDFTHIHFEEVSMIASGSCNTYVWEGTSGWVMHVTGEAETIAEARNKVYSIIDKIILPMKFYRTDIGNRVQNVDLPLLKSWGLL